MIQDIYPYILNNQYEAKKPQPEDSVMIFSEGRLMVKEGALIDFPSVQIVGEEKDYIYLFSVSDRNYFLLDNFNNKKAAENNISLEGYEYKGHREFAENPKENVFAAYTAKHLYDWYSNNVYCGRCGCKMAHSIKERALICSECKNTLYPRIMPAVIVGVKNKDSLLLTKYRTGFAHNALIAGFVEIGETVEETVRREVMEEAGLRVKNITYYKSQPWGTVSDILLGYYCEVDGDDTITMDEGELKYADWVKREDIVLQPHNYSLTNEMMRMFKENRDPECKVVNNLEVNMNNFRSFQELVKKKGLGSTQYSNVNGDSVYLSRGIKEIFMTDKDMEQKLIELVDRFQKGDLGTSKEYGKASRPGHEYGRYELELFEDRGEIDTAVWIHRAEDAIMVFFSFER